VKTGWGDLQETVVHQWFKDFKAWEQEETFKRAFDDDRITIRATAYGTGSFLRGAAEKDWEKDPNISNSARKAGMPDAYVIKSGAVSQFNTDEGRSMKLAQGMQGIMARGNPENFDRTVKTVEPKRDFRKKADPNPMPIGWTKKYWLGLHDLSAILLRHDWEIDTQLKYYSQAVWTFMPVPLEDDLLLFNRLNTVSKENAASERMRRYVRMIAGKMTRIPLTLMSAVCGRWTRPVFAGRSSTVSGATESEAGRRTCRREGSQRSKRLTCGKCMP
jgi:hypothetical protein